ncbi:hypothetical protein K2173_025403 [Erythroxylum novogranatense]|uniref:S-adenosyl-L-methionine-dependent methyltransferase n=1 Tax=Erythroxylum novogranatense TaxID=1862640 RepID=A0AAV8UIX6_9ROSI|nr:hypothetical protein K2173_025403 [Erythroxylum novogranatense]
MEWSAISATKAYLDTLELCGERKRRYDSRRISELGSNEFISALAAGMKAKLIVEVTSGVSPSTVALAAAARHTGGKLVCIVPEPVLADSKQVIKETGLIDMVEFKTGDPSELLSHYEKIDFSLVDCKNGEFTRVLKLLDVNPSRSVVVANNLAGDAKGLGGHVRGMKDKVAVRSRKHPIGKGMEITLIGKFSDTERRDQGGGHYHVPATRHNAARKTGRSSKWVFKVDEESGEEHIYRMLK